MQPLEKSSMAVAANKSMSPLLEITVEMSNQLPAEQLTEVTVGDVVDMLPQATPCVLSMEISAVSADTGKPSPSKPTVTATTGISRNFRQFIPVPKYLHSKRSNRDIAHAKVITTSPDTICSCKGPYCHRRRVTRLWQDTSHYMPTVA